MQNLVAVEDAVIQSRKKAKQRWRDSGDDDEIPPVIVAPGFDHIHTYTQVVWYVERRVPLVMWKVR